MENNSTNEEQMENVAQEEISQKMVGVNLVKKYLPYLSYLAVAVLFGFLGYYSNPPYEAPAAGKQEMVQTVYKDKIVHKTIKTREYIRSVAILDEVLDVEWAEPEERNEDWFVQVDAYDPSLEAEIHYRFVGSVKSTGPYFEYDVYLIDAMCFGPCFNSPTYRFLKKGENIVHLDTYSKDDMAQYGGDFTILEGVTLEGLDMPESITDSTGKKLILADVWNRVFVQDGKNKLFKSEMVGDVYIDKDFDGKNGFYVRRPDGTQANYTIEIPFLGSNNSVPKIAWNDRTENSFDYTAATASGCGSHNYVDAVSDSVLNRETDLSEVGQSVNGDTIYNLKDRNHKLLHDVYETHYYIEGSGGKKAPFEEFVTTRPLFFWEDEFGRMIKFRRSIYQIAAECGKPVIYLYPEEEMSVHVEVAPVGGMSISEPEHGDGWDVIARPDGALMNLADGVEYPYLYWEGRGGLYETPKQGYVVERDKVPEFINNILAQHGLNAQEIADFTEFWLPRMTAKPYYFITFMGTRVMDELAPLAIDPKPDAIFRILMDYMELDAPIEVIAPPAPRAFERRGFTVVEWGGVLGRESVAK